MNIAEIIILVLNGIGLLLYAYMHGKPQVGKYSFWSKLISVAITIGLLYWAGLFH